MKLQNEELSLATKVKIVGSMALVSALVVVSTGIGVALQKENKLQAAELAKTQLANVEAMKTSFPRFRDTKEFKESAKMAMTKISVDSLPATITAGLDETVDPNPSCDPSPTVVEWEVKNVRTEEGASNYSPNGWSVSGGGNVSIPVTAEYGKYTVKYNTGEACEMGNSTVYSYVFKITPPCPTGVTIGISAIEKS